MERLFYPYSRLRPWRCPAWVAATEIKVELSPSRVHHVNGEPHEGIGRVHQTNAEMLVRLESEVGKS